MSAVDSPAQTVRRAWIPRATYRIQLNKSFTFRDATAIIPYLASLGISHVYCSPYFRARAGSMHGYDVVDHNSLNPEIGDRHDFETFVQTLRAHDMGHIVDIVPNHVGIMGADNIRWMDVLENGQASLYAEFFDIEWHPANAALRGKVLVPVLAEPYGIVLEQGGLELRFERELGSFAIFYHEHRFPLDPRTYPAILDRARSYRHSETLEALTRSFASLPSREDPGDGVIQERHLAKDALKQRLAALCRDEPAALEAVETAVQSLIGSAGDPASFDSLHALLEEQAYRLASWRVASDEINYRRFFDVNDLAGLRVERPAVFAATHELLFELVSEGKIDGLRVDHPDGLRDPVQYFQRLQRRIAGQPIDSDSPEFGIAGQSRHLPIYLVVEKITASFEHLPPSWPVHGETGYHFANVATRMLIDGATRARMDRVYHSFIGESLEWPNVAYEAQHMILRRSLASELAVVATQLARIAQSDRRTRDFTLNGIRQVLAEVIACFPVYRTYVADGVADTDRRYVDWAIAAARRRRSAGEAPLFDFARAALLRELPATTPEMERRLRDFAMKFQQVTAPVTAKGVEDTSLYRYNRLLSLNEVGGEPAAYGASVRAFHADAQHRARFWPHEMLATSTHDTKRSEDVRARISVLSEMTQLWRKTIDRWSRTNRMRKREVEGELAPSRNDEAFLYQTLVGSWPLGELDEVGLAAYRERIEAYMIKAVREAKIRTSWANVNADYEDALTVFIRAALDRRDGNLFLSDVMAFQRRVSRFGLLNAMSQTICKLTAPGVPDIYQGNEIWDFSLVDPDNRRPVDYAHRQALLAELQASGNNSLSSILDNLPDGRAKLYLSWKVLQFRRANEALFRDGEYIPLRPVGRYAANVCAFARKLEAEWAITIAPRLYLRLLGEREDHPLGAVIWEDTAVEFPREYPGPLELESVLDGNRLHTMKAGSRVTVRLADALAHFPVALLASARAGPEDGRPLRESRRQS